MSSLGSTLAVTSVVYVVVLFAISVWSRGKIHSTEDYLVAGRRLPLILAWPTLFATWFGAGTLLTATDEVREEGLRAAALDPVGAGVCLLIAGFFFAIPLWNKQLLTLADYYRRRFGPRTEVLASIMTVPGYCGWIAAQFVALAHVMNLFFGLDVTTGIILVAVIGTGYTLLGGMWSVTLTDAAQMILLIVGIIVLAWVSLTELADGSVVGGLIALGEGTPAEKLVFVPTEDLREFVIWSGVLCAGVLGNLPGQDLMQRVFAAKSANTARAACLIAGVLYLLIGAVPLLTGLVGNLLFPDAGVTTMLPFLAQKLLSAPLAIIFLLAVMSAVLSTVDSAILAPASVLSQNLLSKIRQERYTAIQLNQIAVIAIGALSLVIAFAGEDAYSLLESAYEIGVVSLLVPLCMGMFTRMGSEWAGLACMAVGSLAWLFHVIMGWDMFLGPRIADIVPLPMGICCAGVGLIAFLIVTRVRGETSPEVEVAA